jgi:hypothetical protein
MHRVVKLYFKREKPKELFCFFDPSCSGSRVIGPPGDSGVNCFLIRGIFDIFQPVGIGCLSLKCHEVVFTIRHNDNGFVVFY